LVYASKRDRKKWQLYAMNLENYTSRQLTDGGKVRATGAVVSDTGDVFFFDGNEVRAVNIRTLAERTITKAPDGYDMSSISATADGLALAFSITEKVKLVTKTDKIYSDMAEHYNLHPWSALMTGQADGTSWHEVARQKEWISHTMISPTNPNPILYCHEGSWKVVPQRLWLATADGQSNQKLRPEETPEVSIGHEYWFGDGVRVGYHGSIPQKGSFVGVANSTTGKYQEFFTPQSNGHTYATQDAQHFVGDGQAKEPFLNWYGVEGEKLVGTRLVRHGSDFSRQEWHPHPRISPDENWIIFTSVKDGVGQVCRVRAPTK
jgi:oligogalacturonide lyase